VAKTERVHAALTADFADRRIERAYWAVVWGVPEPRQGEIDRPIGRSPVNRKKMAVVANGRPAITRYRVLRPLGTAAALIECRLLTGRTHQIRVHMAAIGHPLVGDPVYGGARSRRGAPSGFARQALHAWLLGFTHPANGCGLRFESRIPADLAGLISNLELL
jgi:23S rRNA pseudouridine1911/1915/1917 synthase